MTQHLIIGAGIAGLTLALGCARRGVQVVVCERSTEMQRVGAGLTLSASARAGLAHLGLGDEIDRLAEPPDPAVVLDWKTGKALTTRSAAPPHLWEARRMARADLQALLLDRLLETGKASLRLGMELRSIDARGPRPLACFTNDETVEADLVFGADGARSAVRNALFADGTPAYSGRIAWRFMLDRAQAEPFMDGFGATITSGLHSSLTCYTMGQGQLINCVAITKSDQWTSEGWSEPGEPGLLARHFEDAHDHARAIVALATGDNLYRWGLFDRPVNDTWSAGRVLLIGDAAHPVVPYLAFGAGLAIEDAVVLDRALARLAPEEAFLAFQRERIPRARMIQAASRAQALAFDSASGWDDAKPPPFLDPAIHTYNPVDVLLDPSEPAT